MHKPQCEICTEFDSPQVPTHYQLRGVPKGGREIARSRHFVLVPDYAPLMNGHLLLLSTPHELSMADHLAGTPQAQNDLTAFFDMYLGHYGRMTVVEHGSTDAIERETPCIAHAHLHLLPIEVGELRQQFRADASPADLSIAWSDLPRVAAGSEYVLVGERDHLDVAAGWSPTSRQYARSITSAARNLSAKQTYSDTCISPEMVQMTLTDWQQTFV